MPTAPRPARLPLRSPVDLLDPRSAVPFARASTINVSMRGACVSVAGPVARGQRVSLRLRGPAGTTRAEGRVVWVAAVNDDETPRLIGLDILQADGGWHAVVHEQLEMSRKEHARARVEVVERVVEEAAEVEQVLVEVDEEGPRPRARRMREKLDVLLKLADGSQLGATSIDVSATGLALFVSEPQPHGAQFDLEVALPDGTSCVLFATTARIRRTPMREAQVHFMGVRVLAAPPAWDRYVGGLSAAASASVVNPNAIIPPAP